MSTLYERIIEQTEKNHINGKKLGVMLGLKKSPLTDWKNGKSNPTLEQLIKMCDIFSVSADYLLLGKPIQEESQDIEEILSIYKKLDSRGKHRIHTIMYEELDRTCVEKTSH